MPNFWDNLGATPKQQTGFNIQDFIKFSQQMQGKDANQMLQQMMDSGKFTPQQIENAKSQANSIYNTLRTIGLIK